MFVSETYLQLIVTTVPEVLQLIDHSRSINPFCLQKQHFVAELTLMTL